MKTKQVLEQIFPAGYNIEREGSVFSGIGETASGTVAIIGSSDHTVIGVQEALLLSRYLLKVIKETPKRPILLMVDNNGQKMALFDELLGLNQYLAFLAKLQDYAMRSGHQVIALVYGNSSAGAFIGFGLSAGHTYALPDADTYVMSLPAIARVTKLPLNYLKDLSTKIAVFAPGIQNFYLSGGLQEIWNGDLNLCLEKALTKEQKQDLRAKTGAARKGRPVAEKIIERVINA